jgi:hypothetical protein
METPHPQEEEITQPLSELELVKKENAELKARLQIAGGYHMRTEREVEIVAALEGTPPDELDSADHAIFELLEIIDAGRNRVYTAEEGLRATRQRLEALGALAATHIDGSQDNDPFCKFCCNCLDEKDGGHDRDCLVRTVLDVCKEEAATAKL